MWLHTRVANCSRGLGEGMVSDAEWDAWKIDLTHLAEHLVSTSNTEPMHYALDQMSTRLGTLLNYSRWF